MSEQPVITQGGGAVPEFDLTDRMRKSLREAGLTTEEMADYLDINRATVSAWLNGATVAVRNLRLWAIRCGVDYDWLMTGKPANPPAEEASAQLTDGVF